MLPKSALAFLFVISFASFAQARDWTLLVYLNGHNNLDDFGWDDLNEMEKVGSTERMTVVVQWASLRNATTKRLKIEKDESGSITSTVVQELPRVDMGDPKSLVEFVTWATQNYPAEHYFLDLWNHGGGWHNIQGINLRPADISWDDQSGNSISTEELGVALSQIRDLLGRKLEILGMDACLMAMIEVATQVKASVNFIAASQEVEPGAGWDYVGFLGKVNASTQWDAMTLGQILTDSFLASYDNGSQGWAEVTFSILDLSQIDFLNATIEKLVSNWQGLGNLATQELQRIAAEALSFEQPDSIDLGDLILLADQSKNPDVRSPYLLEVRAALNRVVRYKGSSPLFSRASGLSIWLPLQKGPVDEFGPRYRVLDFNAETQWQSVIAKINSI